MKNEAKRKPLVSILIPTHNSEKNYWEMLGIGEEAVRGNMR